MTKLNSLILALTLLFLAALVLFAFWPNAAASQGSSANREEVIFWHFWGGQDRLVVEEVIERFNAFQARYRVRGIAMPGNNLDLKVFLAITGGKPPDVINQDKPILADWAERGALLPLAEIASPEEITELKTWLYPAARKLSECNGELYALCNGLDIRALYYNRTLLAEHGLTPPTTLAELDHLAEQIAPPGKERREVYGFLPDARRLWSWGPVFGGGFAVDQAGHANIDTPENQAALEWMSGYRERYGGNNLAAFRQGDQSLPGKVFPLLTNRYAVIMDGQWRVREIRSYQRQQRAAGEPISDFGVCPLPPPPQGVNDAGWVNGNFFVVPQGAKTPRGAWEFMKFWSGFAGHEAEAARTCAAGGWIPVSRQVVSQPEFQRYLEAEPLFAEFVRLAGSEHQLPVPLVRGAALFRREIERIGEVAMYHDRSPAELLAEAERNVNGHLRRQYVKRP